MAENAVRWFEIYVQDMARARRFYETVLGVKLEQLGPVEQDLEMWAFQMSPDRPGAGGALVRTPGMPSTPGGTMVYFGCEDCAVEGGRVVAVRAARREVLPDERGLPPARAVRLPPHPGG